MLVELPGSKGVGKLESAANGRCIVSVFHSIRRTETLDLSLGEVGRAYLSPQTRVYVYEGERFKVGRVSSYFKQDNGLIDYEIRFPNGKQKDVSEIDLFVRLWGAPEDPAEVLVTGGAETQFLHDRRQVAVESLLTLRASAQGLTSLLSAGVDFVPHQIAAVRRVLNDPIQHYLLADEVGLGKTIEAGLIIRQHLIDNIDTQVLIATPPHLCAQWRSEMINKVRLDQFGEAFECCSHADLFRVSRTPDVLVIDEAHHLVGVDSGPLLRSAQRLQALAREVPILLLLSATPPLGEEAKFLALLNLLDPVTHPLDDPDGFRAKLERSREIGKLLLSLDRNAPGLVLRQRGVELQRLFPEDQVVQALAPQLVAATRASPSEVAELCAALKEHVADKYRVHQRLIRSRRADCKGWEFMRRGPSMGADGNISLAHVKTESDVSGEFGPLLAALEDWRFSAYEEANGDEVKLKQAALRYADLLSVVSFGAEELRRWLRAATPSFDGEEDILEALRSIAEHLNDESRLQMMVESTKRLIKAVGVNTSHPKIVVFASPGTMAKAFRESYDRWGDGTSIYVFSTAVSESSEKTLTAFTDPNRSAILVTDQSNEEGLNLSCADAIVHLDLPLSAARLEQRIGRLDRFGRRQEIIRHRILLPSDDDMSPWAAWFELLALGFMIFNRSISDVQFLLDSFEAKAFRTLLEKGPAGVAELITDLKERIEEERKSQDEQYALDRIADGEEPVEPFIQAIEDAEEDEDALERNVNHWLLGSLLVNKHPYAWPEEDPFKLSVTKQTLIPRLPWQAELGIDHAQPLTWKRRIATRQPNVVLLRPGAPLIDVFERFTRWDDRGTAFITYRTVPSWDGGLWIGFKLCFVIEPRLETANLLEPTRGELAASRRAQRYFAPRAHVLYIDINADAVRDEELTSILEQPYRKESFGALLPDINLSSRLHFLAEVIEVSAFQRICRSVRDGARGSLAAQPEFIRQIAAGVQLAEADIERRRSRLARSQSAGDPMARADIELIESLLPCIREPAIRLDAMGCFVIANHPPERKARE